MENAIQTATVPQLLTTEEAATILRTSSHRVRQHIHEGSLKAIRHGRRMVISMAALERFLAAGEK
jgi:excisionase family DNA binding protein